MPYKDPEKRRAYESSPETKKKAHLRYVARKQAGIVAPQKTPEQLQARREYAHAYYILNREKVLAASHARQHTPEGKEIKRKQQNARNSRNREALAAKAKVWRDANPEKSRDASLAYYYRNREARLAAHKGVHGKTD